MNEIVSYQLDGGIATITMDDGKANAMSVAMLAALNTALDHAEADGAVVLLTGRTGMFSGGFDLGVFKRGGSELVEMLSAGGLLTERLLSFPRPVVAACSGHAIAMGVFLLLSTDVRIGVDQGARFHINEVLIGLTLPRFAIEVSRQRLAPAHLSRAAVTAEPYNPQQALEAGFLDAVCPPDQLAATARARAEALLKLNPEAHTATKLRLRAPLLEALKESIRLDCEEWKARFHAPADDGRQA